MVKLVENENGRYLYAIVEGTQEHNFGACGIDGNIVYTIPGGNVSAVVSNLKNEKIRPERRNLAAHNEVLKKLMETSTPLPIVFGIIVDGTNELLRLLKLNQKAFSEQLKRVSGKVEMGLKISWDVPNIFEYFVFQHPELRSARDLYLGRHREPSQEEKIEVGRIFERVLNEDREKYSDDVEEILNASCFEIKKNPPRNERDIVNLACLIARDAQADFEKIVFKTANNFDNNFSFDYSGPWAPHNFVEVTLKL